MTPKNEASAALRSGYIPTTGEMKYRDSATNIQPDRIATPLEEVRNHACQVSETAWQLYHRLQSLRAKLKMPEPMGVGTKGAEEPQQGFIPAMFHERERQLEAFSKINEVLVELEELI